MDTLDRHEGKMVRRAIRAADATLLFVPLCAPARNPIEPLASKLKNRPRHAAEPTRGTVCGAFAECLDLLSDAACANGYASVGCDQT